MNSTLSEDVAEERHTNLEEVLPLHILSDICNRVGDAKVLVRCAATSRTMRKAVRKVQSLNLICLKKYFLLARQRFPVRLPCPTSDDDLDTDSEDDSDEDGVEPCVTSTPTSSSSEQQLQDDSGNSAQISGSSARQPQDTLLGKSTPISGSSVHLRQDALCGRSAPAKPPSGSSSSSSPVYVSFKNGCLNMLKQVKYVKHLRIEVDQEMQANSFKKEEIHMVDFWLSEPMFVRKWVTACCSTLQHLTVVDYGQQAIMRQSPILRVLSENCKQLTHLELRNMYLDTNDLDKLPKLESLTLRCIKMAERSLSDINMCMPALVTLALVSVFGVQEARMTSKKLEVLCLGLSTNARIVDLNLPEVKKLQLKMTCPEILRVHAPKLTYVAVCMEKRDRPEVEFVEVNNLKELLFGASHFSILPYLMKSNRSLEKIFLDLPCMALGEDGKWEGVIKQIPRSLPDIEVLKASCPLLHTLSVGPGLWHSMEESFAINQELATFRRWRTLTRFIVHMVVQSLDNCISVLQWLVDAVPTLKFLEIYVHVDSPADRQLFESKCEEEFTMLTKLTMGTWKRSLNFSCFSF